MGLGDLLRRPAPPGVLGEVMAAEPYPGDTPLLGVELLALDLETTGLDPRRHEPLSFGLVPVTGMQVPLGGARHLPVRPRGVVGESAVVHGLTDDALATAPPVEEVLPQVLRAFVAPGPRRRVLLAHFSLVETRFLRVACRRVYGAGLRLQVVDTLEVERRLLRARHDELREGQLRLDASRRRRGLPRYRAHSAVTDAVACAELFLAQCGELEERRGRSLVLDDVLQP